MGGDPAKVLPDGWQTPDPKTGAPRGIDKGWDYAPGRSVAETVSLAAKKISSLPADIGSSYGAGLQGIIERAWPTWVADTMVRGSHEPGLAGVMSRALISALDARGISPASAEIMVKPGLLMGPKAARHEGGGNDLSIAEWLSLPERLRTPTAVYRDIRTQRLIFVAGDQSQVSSQLAVAMDYRIKIDRKKSIMNMVVSAYAPKPEDIRARIIAGDLELIFGNPG